MYNNFTNEKIIKRAQKLRQTMTRQERHLWYDFLKQRQEKWYRQKAIGHYIVDFYCDSLKLCIELDGSQHYDDKSVAYDKERTAYLEKFGLKVMRFPNNYIDCYFSAVCEEIEKYALSLNNQDK